MNKKEDLRVKKTKANLYKGLIELMEKKSFEDIKVIDICNASFINDLKIELINRLNSYKNIEVDTVKEFFMVIVKELFNYLSENINIYSVLSIVKKNYNSVAHDMMFDAAYTSVCDELNERCINHSNISNESISLFYVSGLITVLAYYIKDPDKFNEKKILEELDKLIPELDYLELKK